MIHQSVVTVALGDGANLGDLESDIYKNGIEALTVEWKCFKLEFTTNIEDFLGTNSPIHEQVDVFWVGNDSKNLPEIFNPQLTPGLHIITKNIKEINLTSKLAAYLITLIGPGHTADVFTKTFIALNGKDYFFSGDHLETFEKKLLFHDLNEPLNLTESSFIKIAIDHEKKIATFKVWYLYQKNNHLLDILQQNHNDATLSLVKSVAPHEYQILEYSFTSKNTKMSKTCNQLVTTVQGQHSTFVSTEQAFHPVLHTHISNPSSPEKCVLNAVYTIPKSLFIDKYQLSDRIKANIGGLQHMNGIWGERDLEAPVWKVHGWGSILSLQIEDDIDLPIHLRYQLPNNTTENVLVEIPVPQILWVCPENPNFSNDHVFSSIFGSNNSFHFIAPISLDPLQIFMPTVHDSHYVLSQVGTAFGILLGFLYLLVKIYTSKMSQIHAKSN